MRPLDLAGDRNRGLDKRGRRRLTVSVAMPQDDQDAWGHGFLELEHLHPRVVLVDREQR